MLKNGSAMLVVGVLLLLAGAVVWLGARHAAAARATPDWRLAVADLVNQRVEPTDDPAATSARLRQIVGDLTQAGAKSRTRLSKASIEFESWGATAGAAVAVLAAVPGVAAIVGFVPVVVTALSRGRGQRMASLSEELRTEQSQCKLVALCVAVALHCLGKGVSSYATTAAASIAADADALAARVANVLETASSGSGDLFDVEASGSSPSGEPTGTALASAQGADAAAPSAANTEAAKKTPEAAARRRTAKLAHLLWELQSAALSPGSTKGT